MALRERTRYNITVLLSQLLANQGMEEMICAEVVDETDPTDIKKLDYASIPFPAGTLSEEDRWGCIVKKADEDGLVLPLLTVVASKKTGNTSLTGLIEDFKTGFDTRVKKIARVIKNKECVLFLGPRLLQCRNGANLEPLYQVFAKDIIGQLKRNKVFYDKKQENSISYLADRFEAINKVKKGDIGNLAMKTYTANRAKLYENVYDKIAQLDFPLIISTTPEDLLETMSPGKYSSGYYTWSNESIEAKPLDESKNIIYKIFGSFENPLSVLVTDSDRVQFSKKVVQDEPEIPKAIRMLLRDKYYLFLGFDFEDWHLKILIDCLGLAKAEHEEKTFALLMDNVGDSSIDHFEKNYKFYFINKELESFLDDVIKAIPAIT